MKLKVDVPNSIIYLNHTPIFECYAVKCGCKNEVKKDMYLEDIDFCTQNMWTILDSLVNVVRGPIWPCNKHENIHFNIEQDNHSSSKNHEGCSNGLDLEFLTILY